MEDNKESEKEEHWHGRHYHHLGMGFWFLRLIVSLVIVVLVFMIGISLGARFGFYRGYGGFGRHLMNPYGNGYGGWNYNPGTGMMNGYGNQNLMGTITAISGNKISITDNANTAKVILSQANTVISNSLGGQLALKDLKVGQNISALGTLDQSNQLLAQIIRVY